MSLEFEQQTYLLRQCFFEVQNAVGRGRREEGYHQACRVCFRNQQVAAVSKMPHYLMLKGQVAHTLYPDFVVGDSITVELKAVPRQLAQSEFVQLFDYLKFRRDRLGLLVNMGLDRVAIERVVYDPPETAWTENWDSWTGQIEDEDRRVGLAVREALHAVYAEHTTGYSQEVVTKLVLYSLRQHHLEVSINPVCKAYFYDVEVDDSALDCLLIDGRIVLVLSALFDNNDFNVNRTRSYLKALKLRWGVAADFGKRRAEVIGIRRG
jgi:GxxExxY protein